MLIHIYVKPLKRFLQLLWATGLAGSLYLMATQVGTGPCDPALKAWAPDACMPGWLPWKLQSILALWELCTMGSRV